MPHSTIVPRSDDDHRSATSESATAALIELIRLSLDLRVAGDPGVLTSDLVRLAAAHRVDGVLDLRRCEATEEASRRLHQLRHVRARRSLMLRSHLHTVLRAFDRAGIQVLAFKGSALATQTGRAPEQRVGSDIDLLIHPADWVRAHRVLVELGHHLIRSPAPGRDQRTRFIQWSEHEVPYVHPLGTIDLHWRLAHGRTPGLTMEALWTDRVEVDDAGITLPTFHPDAALAHVSLHGAKDQWRDLRSTVDAHLLLLNGASWAGAAQHLPAGPSIRECAAGVAILRSGNGFPRHATMRTPDERAWLTGAVVRPGIDEDGRPAGGIVRYVHHQIVLTPDIVSAAAIIAAKLLPSDSLASPPVPARWWLAVIPARVARFVKRYAVIIGRRLGLPLAPPHPLD